MEALKVDWCGGCGNQEELGPDGYCRYCHPLLPPHEAKRLVDFAHEIAWFQRGERNLQTVEVLQAKLANEIKEFKAEMSRPASEEQRLDLLSEAADLVYYAAQLDTYGVNVRPEVNNLLFDAHIYRWTAMSAALVKYSLRSAAPNNKNKDAERESLRSVED